MSCPIHVTLLASALALGFTASAVAGAPAREDVAPRDPFFGEAVYQARQGHFFEALERLDAELGQHRGVDEPELDALYRSLREAEFSVGDFELDYRMHLRAGRAITAVLEGAVEESVRNDAAYRLARINFQKGQFEDALNALDRIGGRLPDALAEEIAFLRANTYLGLGRQADAADVLRRLQGSESLAGFAAYNFGIALLESERRQEALEQLDRAGQTVSIDEPVLAIRDKSNFVLGSLLVESQQFEGAKQYFDRVRLEGPFSNAALLASGWAAATADDYERAVVPWSLLAQREITDAAVQEALIALPYAYGKLEVHGRAAVLYANALEAFGKEVERVDSSLTSIRDGDFLKVLVREEVRQDKDWVIRLRSLPEAPETYYLMELLASQDFQTALQNYLDLEDLRRKLASWVVNFDAFDDLVSLRRGYYEPQLPGIDAEFRDLDSRMRLRTGQHELLERRLQGLLVEPRPDFLATAEERAAATELAALAGALEGDVSAKAEALRERLARLRGALEFTLRTEYDNRLNVFAEHLRDLGVAVEQMGERHAELVRARQAAVHGYEGYETPIGRLRRRVSEALGKVNLLLARQGRVLELVAIDELVARRERLETYRDQARYALADSYDRATRARAAAETAALQSEGATP